MNKISAYWLIPVFFIGIFAAWVYFHFFYIPSQTVTISPRKRFDVITMALPNDHNPNVFGPKYWEAYHKITENIPCPGCRSKAVPFVSFFHDFVNNDKKKPIYDKENFQKHIDMICKLKEECREI